MLTALVVAHLVMLAPLVWHLSADLWSLRSRRFSLVPYRGQYALYVVVYLGILSLLATIPVIVYPRVFFLALSLVLAPLLRNYPGWRRLIVDPDTGLIEWRNLWLPSFLQGDKSTAYLDSAENLRKDHNGNVNLFGVAHLSRRYWSTGSDNVSRPSGDFSPRELTRLVDSFNAYREAFFQYDTEHARAQRADFRRQREARLAPVRAAREARRRAAEERARRKKAEAEAREKARSERRRARYQQKLK